MKKILIQVIIILCTLLLVEGMTSCKATKNANNKQKGAVIGAASGAVIGAIIGKNAGKGGNGDIGAIIGGVVGGTAGVLIGAKMDKQAKEIKEEIPGVSVERVDEAIVITFDENSGVYFDTDKYDINSKSQLTLNKLIGVFQEYSDTNILIVGHTDSDGPVDYNMNLSKNRAHSVKNYLSKYGINGDRLSTNWFGETQPKHDNSTREGKAQNRRVNIAVLPNDKMISEAKEKSGEN